MNDKLLIVDDDSDIREMLSSYFSKENYETKACKDGLEALKLLKKENFSLILLDIMLPNMDGYLVISKIREFTDIPVIFLTAKYTQFDKILGFTKGCDDYLVKPFDFTELSFRIRAILKRTKKTSTKDDNFLIQINDLIINTKEFTVTKGNRDIKLTPKEFEILQLLASNKGRVYSTKTIYELIWKDSFLENDNSVLVHIRNLREKIGDKYKDSRYIKTIWGVGYKIEKELEKEKEKTI